FLLSVRFWTNRVVTPRTRELYPATVAGRAQEKGPPDLRLTAHPNPCQALPCLALPRADARFHRSWRILFRQFALSDLQDDAGCSPLRSLVWRSRQFRPIERDVVQGGNDEPDPVAFHGRFQGLVFGFGNEALLARGHGSVLLRRSARCTCGFRFRFRKVLRPRFRIGKQSVFYLPFRNGSEAKALSEALGFLEGLLMPIISLCSPKGGAGKTTTAALAATVLADQGESVTMID